MTTRTTPPDDAYDEEERLPCGRPVAEVWECRERRADDPHARTCVHCRRAAEDFERLESAVRGLRDETEHPAVDTASLTRRVMDVVRLELRPGRPLPLGTATENLWITEAVAARALRAAAETVPGVRAGSCRFRDDPEGTAVGVRIEVHAPADRHLPDTARRIRRAVYETADRELGMPVTLVDVVVADVVTPADAQEDTSR
ncbi:Asp23/Gls24 family envelope stress response protein [Streptomyces sp. NPDC012450]|uniref:Asp23/Gls24 family envelope stress response protein n=1 Tax=Streptomyces sp. NPDC012450 TaxID=3364834 RepID=UPI0036E3184A